MADQVRLTNGDVVHGKDLTLSQGIVKVKSKALGSLSISKNKIAQILTDSPVWIIFTNKREVRATILPAGKGYMTLAGGGGSAMAPFTMANLDTIVPGKMSPEQVRKLWKTTGGINLGGTVTTGNVRSKQLHMDANLTAKREKIRYTFHGEATYQRNVGTQETNNALVQLKHDSFFTKKWYFYTNGALEHDSGTSLNLRTSLGTGTGYQIFETDRTDLSVEGGLSYVIEDYSVGSDHAFPAVRWSTDFRYDPWLKKIRLFHYHEIFASIGGHKGFFLRTRTGVRYFMFQGLNATAQVNFNWNSHPAPNETGADTTYLVTLGYAW